MTEIKTPVLTRAHATGTRILIIDHDQSNIDQLSELLADNNYCITTANLSAQGLFEAERSGPDIILLNADMPDIDSQQVYRQLRKQPHTRLIPLIFIKAEYDNQDNIVDLSTTKTSYISKPFCGQKICEQIEAHLLLKSLQDQLNEEIHHTSVPVKKKHVLPSVGSNETTDNAMYRMLVDESPDAILIECEGECVFANRAALLLFHARSVDDLLGRSLISLVAPASHMNATIAFRELEQLNRVHTQEEQALRLDGKTCDISVTRLHCHYAGLPAIQMVARDISTQKHLELQLHYQATHDSITGLPNRNLFMDRLIQAVSYAKRHQNELSVCYIDVDRFKRINDSFGHDAGDQLLVMMAERISSCIRASDTVARMDSDEFALLLPSGESQQNIKAKHNTRVVIERVQREIAKPFILKNQSIALTCTIGYSHFPSDSDNGVSLLKYAQTAVSYALDDEGNCIQQYNASLQLLADEYAELEQALEQAITNQELSLHYQIQTQLHNGSITGIEALLRWQHPSLGAVSPARFIPIAERTGLIERITEWTIKSVCEQNKYWQQQGRNIVPIAVNVSAISLRNPSRLEEVVTRSLEETQLDPTLLELEFTESASMDDPTSVIPLLLRLKTLGVSLAIDDFGTGYSNLHYLKQLPIDKLKLDGSFVRGITAEPRSQAIADAIITLGHRLNLKVIAEMAETKQQVQLLFERGCDLVQGYYFAKPLPADECAELLDGRLLELPYPPRQTKTDN